MKQTNYLAVLVCALFLFASAVCHASIKYVAANGTGNGTEWSTPLGEIQTAIDASSPGDEVRIKAYSDSTVYNQTITLKNGVSVKGGYIGAYDGDESRDTGVDPTYITTISASGLSGNVVSAPSGRDRTAVIEYCTLRGAGGSYSGINCVSASPTISYCKITNNSKGIDADINSAPDIENCIICSNSSSGLFWYKGICNNSKIYGNTSSSGGGVNFGSYSGTDVVFTNNEVYSNSATYGAGVYMANVSSSLVFTNNMIRDNTCSSAGGGIYINTGACNIDGANQITGNTSIHGAGMFINTNTGIVSGNTISDNDASSAGGGLYTTPSSGVITNNTITDNEANNAGGIYNGSGSSGTPCEISRNLVSGNHAAINGGGIYTYTGVPKVYGNVVSSNEAGMTGNGVYLYSVTMFANNTVVNNTYNGSTPCGIFLFSASDLHLYNNIIANNTSYGVYKYSGTYYSHNNCYYNNGNNYNGNPTGSSDDVFANPNFAADGYHLALDSPCINAGNNTVVQQNWLDIDGEARQNGTAVDIGADEYTPLTVTINQASTQADPTNTSPINFTVIFSDSVADFTADDVTISGVTGATKTITGNGTTYNVAVTLPAETGALLVASIPAGVVQNSSLVWNSASTSTDNSVLFLNPPTEVEVQATGADTSNLGKLTIYWKSVPGATGYNIYRGTTSGAENYQNPINGSTPWNTPSFTGSIKYAFTDTGLTFGQEYFYTVKAVVNDGESSHSYEDSEIPDPDAIPWDCGNAYTITNAVNSMYGYTPDLTQALGPDGTVYSSQSGVLRPGGSVDLGTFNPTTGLLQYTDGTSIAVPDDGYEEEQSGLQAMTIIPGLQNKSDGPYRRVRSLPAFTGSYGYFAPGDQNNIYMSSAYPNDTYWTYLGSRSTTNDGILEIDAGLQWSKIHYSYNPYLWVQKKVISQGIVTQRFLAPRVQPIRFISSYPYYYISMCYAFQPYQYSSKGIPMLLIGGYDQGLNESTVLLAAANPVNTRTGMMKRCHSIAQGKPNYCRATGSYFEFAAFASGQLRNGAGQWVTWTDSEDVTADEGSYPLRSATVQWTNPYGSKFFEEYNISVYANYNDQ